MNFPFTAPILMKLNYETEDGRLIESAGFKGLPEGRTGKVYALDQQGVGGHTLARIVGELTAVEIGEADENGVAVVVGKGYIMGDEFGVRIANLIESGLLVGASVDLADDYVVTYAEEYDSETDSWTFKVRFTESSLDGFTIVEKPAFPDAYITLDEPLPDEYKFGATTASATEDTDGDTETPETPDAFDAEVQSLIDGAKTLTAFVRVKETYTPPEVITYDPALFAKPELRRLTPFQYEPETGRIYGHLAGWKSCHGALPECVTPPKSQTGYRYFANMPLHMNDGTRAWVGRLVCDTVHAKVRGITAEQAMAHYATTGAVFGLVSVGEDDHGIWVSGVAAPGVDPAMLTLALACPPSGDWRKWPGVASKELIAGLAVPVPGFNTPQAEFAGEGEQTGLIVSNIPLDAPDTDGSLALNGEILNKLERISAWVDEQVQREAFESRQRRIASLAAAFS